MIYALTKIVSRGLLWLYRRPVVAGRDNIFSTGQVIVVANHTNLLDGFLLVAFWPRQITFLAAAYLFELPVVGAFMRAVGAIPIQKSSGAAGMRTAIRVLQGGGTLALFPEGRIVDGEGLAPFNKGWAYLALKTGAPVIPVVIRGTKSVLPLGAVMPRCGKIHMQIAAPWKMEKVGRPRPNVMEAMNRRLVSQMEQMLSEI